MNYISNKIYLMAEDDMKKMQYDVMENIFANGNSDVLDFVGYFFGSKARAINSIYLYSDLILHNIIMKEEI